MQIVKKPYETPSYSILDVDQTLTRPPAAAAEAMNQGNPQAPNGIPGLAALAS